MESLNYVKVFTLINLNLFILPEKCATDFLVHETISNKMASPTVVLYDSLTLLPDALTLSHALFNCTQLHTIFYK